MLASCSTSSKVPPHNQSVTERESMDEFEKTYSKYNVTAKQKSLIEEGRKLLGTRYRYGGTNPATGMDCSAITRHIYREATGIELPRTARLQNKVGKYVSRNHLLPGDLVFLDLSGDLSHVGVYIGDGKFFHASSSKNRLMVANMNSPYYAKRYDSAVRVTRY